MSEYHKLLQRQIKKYLGKDPGEIAGMEEFLGAVNESYAHFERDRVLLERSMEISNEELQEANRKALAVAEFKKGIIDKLREAMLALKAEAKELELFSGADEELISVAETLRHEIELKHKTQELLASQMEELKKVNAELDRFVYSASHDLRSPLVSLRGLLQIIREEKNKVLVEQYMDLAEKSILKLDQFIRDIIDYSANTRLETSKDPIQFSEMIGEVFESMAHLPEREKVNVFYHGLQEAPFYTDKRRLTVVVSNLVGNGIRYFDQGKEKPFLKVKVTTSHESALLEFEDNGIGIPEQHHSRIFEMFYRANHLKTGSGLGLYIVKETVTRLGGTVSVASIHGEGTKFTVKIPNLRWE